LETVMLRLALLIVLLLVNATAWLGGEFQAPPGTRFSAFDKVVALVGEQWKHPTPERLDLDVEVLVWAPTALLPVPFVRLSHTPGEDLQAELFVWWLHPANVEAGRLPPDRRCSVPEQDTVCVAKIDVVEGIAWGELLADVFASRACARWLSSEPMTVVGDAGDLVVRVHERTASRYDEYVCNAPHVFTSRPGARQAARVMDVLAAAAAAARRR
jgi:hypothetical protein